MARLGVLGWPVSHSRSPAMHNAAFAALEMSGWHYQKLPVPPTLFAQTVRALGGAGYRGANVTIPHKEAALALADAASEAARAIGAANTLSFDPTRGISAANTDAPGLLAALGRSPAGETAMVLGAGGSARAVVWALLSAGAREVSVWNRTPERAQALARELGARAVMRPQAATILVNCTAIGLGNASNDEDSLKLMGLSHDEVGEYPNVVDLVYGEGMTRLLRSASERGANVVDGLEVLVHQGALSFELWTGRSAPLEVMRLAAASAAPDNQDST
jgi:shikimate dehydrogenase